MAIVLDATVSGANSNTYLTLIGMNALVETLPHMKEWLTDPEINRAQLLVHGTRMLDRNFAPFGIRAVSTQALLWPRVNVIDPETGDLISSTAIPDFVEMATAEWAWALHQNPDTYAETGYGLRRLETPSYRMEFNGDQPRVVPKAVTLLMAPYGYSKASPFHRVVRV